MKKIVLLLLFPIFFSCCNDCSKHTTPNIILLIGDGMGLSQISASMYANGNKSALEEFTTIGLVKTHAADNLVTDSASSATAMASGEKTNNGTLGINATNDTLTSILEIFEAKNYRSALLSTATITHATPAAFYAKVLSRGEYETIASQLSNHDVDIFVGGGKKHFDQRSDSINILEKMSKKYDIVNDLQSFIDSKNPNIGYFIAEESPIPVSKGRTPSLGAITKATLDKFRNPEKQPFFMMIEGAQIDWGGHANDTDYIVSEFKDFNGAVKEALAYAKRNTNTLVIVTADHETGGFAFDGESIEAMKGSFTTLKHTATMVPVFAYGPSSKKFSGIMDNTDIFLKMKEVFDYHNE